MSSSSMPVPSTPAGPRAPYRGIEEFRYVDAPIFFGRDFEAHRMLRLITIYRGVLLYGDSGVGKSSLVNAKVLPLAVEDGYAPERIRVQPMPGAEFIVERISPSDEENAGYLPSVFADANDSRRVSVSAADFTARLAEACNGSGETAPYPLLVFDQFEELVTLTEEVSRRGRSAANDAERAYKAIVETLVHLLRDDVLRVKLLFVFREDYYAKLTRFFAEFPTLVDNYLRVEPLHADQLDTIIRGPCEKIAFDHALPEEVVVQLEREFRERSDSDLLNLSEVQIACLRLWNDPDPAALFEKLHVHGLLESYFFEAISRLPNQLRPAADALLDNLVTASGTRNVASTDTLLEALAGEAKIDRETGHEALRALAETAKVIRRERRNDVTVYEIVSEFLVPWIMRQKADSRAKREYEQRTARLVRRGRIVGVTLLAVIGLLALSSLAFWQKSSKEKLAIENATLYRRLATGESTELELRDRNERLASELTETRTALTRIERERGQLAVQNLNAAAEIKRLSGLAASVQQSLESERRKLAEAAAHMQDAEVAFGEALTEINDLNEDLAEQRTKVTELTQQLKSVSTERDFANARYTDVLRTNRNLVDEQKKAKRELDQLRAENTRLASQPDDD